MTANDDVLPAASTESAAEQSVSRKATLTTAAHAPLPQEPPSPLFNTQPTPGPAPELPPRTSTPSAAPPLPARSSASPSAPSLPPRNVATSVESTGHHGVKDDIKERIASGDADLVLNEDDRPVPDMLQNITNFRDVGKNANADLGKDFMKEGNLFRSGRLDDATTEDMALLTDMFHIKTVIDLRSETEGKMGEEIINTFPASAISEQIRLADLVHFLPPPNGPDPSLSDNDESDGSDESGESADNEENPAQNENVGKSEIFVKEPDQASLASVYTDETDSERGSEEDELAASTHEAVSLAGNRPRQTYYINFAGSSFRYYSVWKPLSWRSKLKVISLMAWGQKPAVIELVGNEVINPAGLNGLNDAFIKYCGPEITQALRLMSVPSHYPLLVHCTQGKDRTGLVIALALFCAGASMDLIVRDYVRTQRGLERQRDIMVEEMRKTGLDPVFSDAPASAIKYAFELMDKDYGGPSEYLSKHGFGIHLQNRLAACLRLRETSLALDSAGQ